MASFPLSKSARKNGASSYENHTAIDAQEREGGSGINLNGRAGKLTARWLVPQDVFKLSVGYCFIHHGFFDGG